MIVVVVIVVVSVVGFLLLTPSTPPVQVQLIAIWAPDNVCGLMQNPIAFDGYNASTGQNISLDLVGVQNYNTTPCTIRGVVTNTTGFSLSGVEVPLTIPANDTNGSMNLTIGSPGTSFSGNLNLVFS